MKKYWLGVLCAITFSTFAQQQELYVEKADGTKLPITSAKIDYDSEKAKLRIKGDAKETKFKFEELKTISYAGYLFRVFKIKKKFEGFYIMSESADKYLCFFEYQKIANKGGGFESTFTHVDYAVFDKQGNLLDRYDLRQTNNKNNTEIREKVSESIRKHFSDCPEIIKHLDTYDKPDKKYREGMLSFFGRPDDVVPCK